MKMVQVTVFKSFDEMIDTQYGLIKYSDWLRQEKSRIDSDASRSSEIRVRGDQTALYANQVVLDRDPERYRSWKKRGKK
jgi:hypothetical protein